MRPRLRENFADVMQRGLRRHGLAALNRMITRGSVLVDLGFVDPDLLRDAVRAAAKCAEQGRLIDTGLYDVIVLDRCLTELLG